MPEFDLEQFNAARAALPKPLAPIEALVFKIDANNILLAWHDSGTFKGKAFDKWRVGPFYWSARDEAWLQGSGSLSVPYEQRDALLDALSEL